MKSNRLQVAFFQRKPHAYGNHSLEALFKEIRRLLTNDIDSVVVESRFGSRGVLRRLYNMLEAMFRQSEVNHITGDVHYLALFLHGHRTILTIHDCVFLHRQSAIARFFFRLFWLRLPVSKARFVTVVSEATKNEVLANANCPPDKIVVIPAFISSSYKPFPKPFNRAKPVVLQVGLAPNKNLERLVKAIEGLDCHLSIVGKLEQVHIRTLEESGVEYSSAYNISEEEMLQKYEECDIVAFASMFEGFGLPIIEGNAVGRAVLTSNCSSMPEVAGDAACLVDPFSVKSIRKGLVRIIEDDEYRDKLIQNGFENCARFDEMEIARKYLNLYQQIARR